MFAPFGLASGLFRHVESSVVHPMRVVVPELSTQCHPLAIRDLGEIQNGNAWFKRAPARIA